MKKILFVFLFTASSLYYVNAQYTSSCKNFTQTSVDILNKNDFIPDGRYHSVKLSQGDKINIYKPFYVHKEYLIVSTCENSLPGIKIAIQSMSKKMIFQSEDFSQIHKFKYKPERNQNLIISIEVGKSDTIPVVQKACTSVIIGFK